jgi:MFS family permease
MESIPNSVRGKYAARKHLFSRVAAFVAVTFAGYILGQAPDLSDFMLLFAIGVPIGLFGVWLASFIPGGAPERGDHERSSYGDMLEALQDRRFVLFVLGSGLITLTLGPLTSFVPLFMQERVGLSSGNTVLLDTGIMVGSLLSSYLWGWAADRYGSSPVMLSGIYLQALLPVAWLLMPRHSTWSLYVALAVATLSGIARMGWMIGSRRLLFVNVVPVEKKAGYTSLRLAWVGMVGGLGKLVGGRVLDLTSNVSGQFLTLTLDPYTPLFLVTLALPLLSAFLLRRVRTDSRVTTGQFAGMFVRGNPLQALTSLLRFHRARDEQATVSRTEDLGEAHSPLTVEELLEALEDPRFYVRYEAIVSIARTSPSKPLMKALTEVLAGNSPALSVVAAWALGRIGDQEAIPALREGLNARYRSIQAHCARSLGSIGDRSIAPLLLRRMKKEEDQRLRLAYASALGKLGDRAAVEELLAMLHAHDEADFRDELSLALARLMGDEHRFVELLREARVDLGTAMSQAVFGLRRKLRAYHTDGHSLLPLADACAGAFARDNLEDGVDRLRKIIDALPLEEMDAIVGTILSDCASQLVDLGANRIEYAILAVQAIDTGLQPEPGSILARVLTLDDLDPT